MPYRLWSRSVLFQLRKADRIDDGAPMRANRVVFERLERRSTTESFLGARFTTMTQVKKRRCPQAESQALIKVTPTRPTICSRHSTHCSRAILALPSNLPLRT